MRIRNKKSYALGLSYAGLSKSYTVKAGGLSPELPPDRFYHAQLQRDWKRGYIDVLLSETDKAVLGSSVSGYKSGNVEITVVPDVPETPKPQPTSPTAQTIKTILQERVEDRAARITAAREAAEEKTAAVLGYNDAEQGANDEDDDGAEPLDDLEDDSPVVAAGSRDENALCGKPGCKTANHGVQYDERVSSFLCQYCRQQVTRRRNMQLKKNPAALMSDLYAEAAEFLKLNTTPPVLVEPDPVRVMDLGGQRETPPELGYGISLADLNK